jgi:hypothetical protein
MKHTTKKRSSELLPAKNKAKKHILQTSVAARHMILQ